MYLKEDIEYIKRIISWPDLLNDLGFQKINVQTRRCCCLLHNGKNQNSFSWKQDSFKCFSCQKSGDAIDLVKAINNCSFREAVKFLAAKIGFFLEESDMRYQQKSIYEREIPEYFIKKIEKINYKRIDLERQLKKNVEDVKVYSDILLSMKNDYGNELYTFVENKLNNLDEEIIRFTHELKNLE